MAKTYFLDNAAGTHTLGGAFTHLLSPTDPADGSDTVTAASGSGVNQGYYEEPENTGVTRTSTGTFSVELNITTGTASTNARMRLLRVNSSGTTQATSANTAYQSTAAAGLLTFSLVNPALGTWASTDRLVVVIEVQNTAAHGGASGPTWATGTTNAEVVTPFTNAAVTHATTGALTGQIGSVAGAATRFRAHPSSGALTGAGATVAGSASRAGPSVTHASSGDLTGQIGAVAGSAARTRAHASSGALAGQGSTISGASTRYRAFASSGSLTGQGATVAGTSARTRVHPSSGVLAGSGSQVSGSASRSGAPVTHTASGAIIGSGAVVSGAVSRSGGAVEQPATWGFVPRLRKRRIEIEPEVVQAIEAIAEEAPKVEVSQADADALMRAELQRIGIAYQEAYTEIYLELLAEMRQQQEDEQIAAVMVALL